MRIALNYIYLEKSHSGGKDQVGLNLLKGFYDNNIISQMCVICFEYSVKTIESIAPGIKIIPIKYKCHSTKEMHRMAYLTWVNTVIIPKIVKKYSIDKIFHLGCNNGLVKLKCTSISIPFDIKAVAHRVLAHVKIPFYKYIIHKIMYYIDFKNADTIVAMSDVDKAEIAQYYPKFANKIRRIYCPIKIELKNIKHQSKTTKNIVALNLQFHHKNIITLIKAFELIKDKCDYNLLLIGKVPQRVSYLKDYVKNNHLEQRIKFTGFISEDAKNKLFQTSALYVNPTLYEGFGMTAVEAIILKIPTLVSRIATNYEITQGLCDYYEPAEDEHALAEMLLKCLKKNYDNQDLDKKSKLLLDKYDYRRIANEYYKLFVS
ncbi:glycosyltransferase involved in cell wall biosynthesis [Catenibacillus scindens]|uniref:Glycosyltransferase involved in cell wall biosynthesis n=1 Tax=Catenibacillus scindens TaxID=673271 RepID=A0A7W8HAL1_9FIRM|nr:glycosyltransferase [Catenibacillus scindens]MBB5264808.1 glycosyltransferase involved in cell wall biosynthesis [Catenibacillus scindens]